MNGEVIQTCYGKVIGIPSDTQGVTVFKGIPIGADTGKENRFRAPQPPESWEGVRGCDHYGDRFLQIQIQIAKEHFGIVNLTMLQNIDHQ